MDESLWTLVSNTVNGSGSIEKSVFYLLACFSLVSWVLVFMKLYDVIQSRRNSQRFLELFDGADRFGAVMTAGHTVGNSPLMAIFKAGMATLENRRPSGASAVVSDPRQIALNTDSNPEGMLVLNMQHASLVEFGRLQKGLGFLATIGSTAPFIGLFGTVWGIMHTFRDLSSMKSGVTIAVVAPGIAASLIATAAGLAVAIPAVMAYNWFLASIDDLQDQAETFMDRMLALVRASGCLNTNGSIRVQPEAPVLNAISNQYVAPAQYVPPNAVPGEPINPPIQAKNKPAVQT
jgi:biopolymer transport protein TolQ